ncbi:MAG: biotin synthase BioB, partial [Candidatus Nitrosotenuis sp.]
MDGNNILQHQDRVLAGEKLTEFQLSELINSSDLKTLSSAANKITRKFQGSKVDVEQLANI